MPTLITLGLAPPPCEGGGATPAFVLNSITPAHKQITLVFSNNVAVSGPALEPAQWIITSLGSGVAGTVMAVQPSSAQIILTTNELTNGQSYKLTIPQQGLIDTSNNEFDGNYNPTFNAVGVTPSVVMARSIDARSIDVYFSEAVNETDALTASKYSIDNGLSVVSVSKITDLVYRLTTTKQTIGATYNVTASGIRDLANNPM